MQQWQIGSVRVTRIEELLGPMFDPIRFLPDFDPAEVERHREWLCPDHVDPESGRLVASMHSWLIETRHHNILVDTCIGDDKDRMPYQNWHHMKSPWSANLRRAGVSFEDIDFVFCTHLHVDHVGWNTRLENGQWVPTFPNARYLFSETEFRFWEAERRKAEDEFHAVNNKTFDDSVLPILHQAELIEGEAEVIADLLHLGPAPGHTPGSMTARLTSGGKEALFTGDICHHPLQVVRPEWNSAYCELPEQARETRLNVLSYCENHGALLLPAHFGHSHAATVKASDNAFCLGFS